MNRWADDHGAVFTIVSALFLGLLAGGVAFAPWVGMGWGLMWFGLRMPIEYVRHR